MNRRTALSIFFALQGALLPHKSFAGCGKPLTSLAPEVITDSIIEKLARLRDDRIRRERLMAFPPVLTFAGRELPILRRLDDRNHVFLVRADDADVVFKRFFWSPPRDYDESAYRREMSRQMAAEVENLAQISGDASTPVAEVLAVDETRIAILKRYVDGVSFLEISLRGAEYGLSPGELEHFRAVYSEFDRAVWRRGIPYTILSECNLYFDLEARAPVLIDPI